MKKRQTSHVALEPPWNRSARYFRGEERDFWEDKTCLLWTNPISSCVWTNWTIWQLKLDYFLCSGAMFFVRLHSESYLSCLLHSQHVNNVSMHNRHWSIILSTVELLPQTLHTYIHPQSLRERLKHRLLITAVFQQHCPDNSLASWDLLDSCH